MTFRERLIWWLGIDVALGLTPLAFNAFSGASVGWYQAISHGELMIISVAITAMNLASAAISDPIRSSLREARASLIAGGLIFTLAAGFLYADSYRATADNKPNAVGPASYVLFAIAIALGVIGALYSTRVQDEKLP